MEEVEYKMKVICYKIYEKQKKAEVENADVIKYGGER